MKPYLLFFCLAASPVTAENTQIFESAARRVSLIELYTSEGCSSCPSAERRLNQFENHPGLWTDFVPVAFHVDYWNYIGWHDRFSSPEFTARQRQYSKHWKARTIYTPCFVMNGNATRSPHPKVGKKNPGKLTVTVKQGRVSISFKPATEHATLQAWLTPLSGKETSAVKSGENRGRKLEHCFIALDLQQTELKKNGESWTGSISIDSEAAPAAIAVWISNSRTLEPIQATGGWLK